MRLTPDQIDALRKWRAAPEGTRAPGPDVLMTTVRALAKRRLLLDLRDYHLSSSKRYRITKLGLEAISDK